MTSDYEKERKQTMTTLLYRPGHVITDVHVKKSEQEKLLTKPSAKRNISTEK